MPYFKTAAKKIMYNIEPITSPQTIKRIDLIPSLRIKSKKPKIIKKTGIKA